MRATHHATSLPPHPIWRCGPHRQARPNCGAALAAVTPACVYLFGVAPGLDRPDTFLRRLGGLVKHTLRVRCGRVRFAELTAALAAREATVRQGLFWLAAHGNIILIREDGEEVEFAPGDGVARPDLPQVTARLEALLAETAAYRAYFATANGQSLIQGAWAGG